MNFIKRNIPNAITCGNLLCGCLAIVKSFEGNLVWAAYLVGIAAVLDFFDGFTARMLKVSSPIGKDLDSLADMVTFGVVPGIVMFQMVNFSMAGAIGTHTAFNFIKFYQDAPTFLPYMAFIIPVFSAIRLAKFNNDLRQSESFIGFPTPANAIMICSFPLVYMYRLEQLIFNPAIFSTIKSDFIFDCFINPYTLIVISIVLSLLLVSELPLFSLKFKHFKWKGNEIRFVFLLSAITLLVLLKFVGIPLIIVLYILLSLISNIINKKKNTSV